MATFEVEFQNLTARSNANDPFVLVTAARLRNLLRWLRKYLREHWIHIYLKSDRDSEPLGE